VVECFGGEEFGEGEMGETLRNKVGSRHRCQIILQEDEKICGSGMGSNFDILGWSAIFCLGNVSRVSKT
jgi:hypothetical protein